MPINPKQSFYEIKKKFSKGKKQTPSSIIKFSDIAFKRSFVKKSQLCRKRDVKLFERPLADDKKLQTKNNHKNRSLIDLVN